MWRYMKKLCQIIHMMPGNDQELPFKYILIKLSVVIVQQTVEIIDRCITEENGNSI